MVTNLDEGLSRELCEHSPVPDFSGVIDPNASRREHYISDGGWDAWIILFYNYGKRSARNLEEGRRERGRGQGSRG